MPESITVAAFVFGVILIIAALVGKDVKIAAVELPALTRNTRVLAALLGCVLVYIGLINPFSTTPGQPPAAVSQNSMLSANLLPTPTVAPLAIATPTPTIASTPSVTPTTPQASPAASASSTDEVDFTGSYLLGGAEYDTTPYTGTLNVTRQDAAYRVLRNTTVEALGIGIVQNKTLAVAYGSADAPCGVIVYTVQKDGTLKGRWLGTQRLTPGTELAERSISQARPGIGGSYKVTGTNTDDTPYHGTLKIDVRGAVYEFSWVVGASSYRGIGVRQNDVIAVGWGTANCGIIAYSQDSDRSLHGVWGVSGQTQVGAEDADPQ